MADARIRRQIALVAARLMYEREESEYFTAKRKAARQLGVEYRFRPKDLPSNREIRDQIQALANLHEGEQRAENLRAMRLDALRMMRLLGVFYPKLIGSVLTGHVRKGSDIDIHVFTDHPSAITTVLEEEQFQFQVERKRVIKQNEERHFTHVHISGRFNFELTLYSLDKRNYGFISSITGRAIEKATVAELQELILREHPGTDIESELNGFNDHMDRFDLFRMLLEPLERVRQNAEYHPEGDALYHSLQVFELACRQYPWDEEFLLAALLHDVGKAIDPADHVEAGVSALEGAISDRTQFLIEHHMEALAYNSRELGHRARVRLQESEHFEDLMNLRDLDSAGRQRGAVVCTITEALEYIRSLESESYL
jgi:predicted HD phosphohydrolase/predicted nucleotidyltransferase